MGPFPAGDWPDVEIFRFALKNILEDGERVEVDDGYVGEDPAKAKTPSGQAHDQDERMLYVRGRVRRRQETVNKRMKQFKCLATVFRHNISFHGTCFHAVAVLTQLSICLGHPLFPVQEYQDQPRSNAA